MIDKKLLIIKTGSTLPAIKNESGDFEDWILEGMEVDRDQAVVRNVEIGEILPVVSTLSGAVITGSHAMVSDLHNWSEMTAGWLRTAIRADLPVLGICYGHQLLAHALGGAAGPNPLGPEYGTVEIELLPDAAVDPLFQNLPSLFKAQVSHAQSALKLPGNSVVLARSSREPHQAFRVGDSCWGIQFHPEFSPKTTIAYISEHQPELTRMDQTPDQLISSCSDTPDAVLILKGFASFIRT